MSTCGEVSSDAYVPIKELVIRWVEHRSEIHSNKSQHLVGGTKVACLRRRFSFVLQQTVSFRTRHHLFSQRMALGGTGQLRSQGPVSVQAYCTDGVTGSERREGANGARGGGASGDGNGVGGRNRDVHGDGDGDGA